MRLHWKKRAVIELRNLLYAMAPSPTAFIEDVIRLSPWRRQIRAHGFEMPFPPFVKRSILQHIIKQHDIQSLVETGTFLGDTPWHFRRDLEEIYSVELSEELARIARKRLRAYTNITIVTGDSAEKLSEIIPQLRMKTLFWLDGHFSSGVTTGSDLDCPIFKELMAIVRGCPVPWIILIDDARCFGRDPGYPTIADLERIRELFPMSTRMVIEHDMIGIHPVSD